MMAMTIARPRHRRMARAGTAACNLEGNSHGGGAHLHVLAALPNTLLMESGLLPAQERLVDGCYLLPEEPGLGGQS